MMTVVTGDLSTIVDTAVGVAPIMTDVASLPSNQSIARVILQYVRSRRLRSSMLCTSDDQSSFNLLLA